MATELKDARGVKIAAGDTVIYGFGVGRSVAMAEGVVEGDLRYRSDLPFSDQSRISLTASGRVRIRVVRRSYGGGEKPVVDIAPDRIVVLKSLEYRIPGFYGEPELGAVLPPSPLPTQDEDNYGRLVAALERHLDNIERLATGGPMDNHETSTGAYPDYTHDHSPERRAYWLDNYRRWEAETRKDLEATCARLDRPMPAGLRKDQDRDD